MHTLMEEKQFSEITIQDITDHAEVNRATFYKHFVDKYDILNAIVRENFQRKLDEKLPPDPIFTRDNLYLLIQTVYEYVMGVPGRCSSSPPENDTGLMVRQVQIQTYLTLTEWLKRSAGSTTALSVSPEIAAMTTSWMIFGTALHFSWGKHTPPNPQLIDEIMNVVQLALKDYLTPESALVG